MSFHSEYFAFDGVPCEFYNLRFYSFEPSSSEESNLFTGVEIVEDRISRRPDPIHYGTIKNAPLEFSLTFGSLEFLDKDDISAIAGWLTGHNDYKTLEIFQSDMNCIRYKCIINNLRTISINGDAIAFQCDVVCDTQFGYGYPCSYLYNVHRSAQIRLFNQSAYNGYLYPHLVIKLNGAGRIMLKNETDGGRETFFDKLPASSGLTLTLDNKNQILTSSDPLLNCYEHFNYHFFRLAKGTNIITAETDGDAEISLTCEFLMKVGG